MFFVDVNRVSLSLNENKPSAGVEMPQRFQIINDDELKAVIIFLLDMTKADLKQFCDPIFKSLLEDLDKDLGTDMSNPEYKKKFIEVGRSIMALVEDTVACHYTFFKTKGKQLFPFKKLFIEKLMHSSSAEFADWLISEIRRPVHETKVA